MYGHAIAPSSSGMSPVSFEDRSSTRSVDSDAYERGRHRGLAVPQRLHGRRRRAWKEEKRQPQQQLLPPRQDVAAVASWRSTYSATTVTTMARQRRRGVHAAPRSPALRGGTLRMKTDWIRMDITDIVVVLYLCPDSDSNTDSIKNTR
jgi:hypothetical protein